MTKAQDIDCRHCGGTNPPDSVYCWYCGARLPRHDLSLRRVSPPVRIALQVFKWVVALSVVASIAYGLYHVAEHFLLPVFQQDQEDSQIVGTASSVGSPATTFTTTPRVEHILPGGADRYATAVAISQLGFPDGAAGLVLAPGDDYQKSMCAVPLAAAYRGPILYVPPAGLRADVRDEIKRLNPAQVFLINVSRSKTVAAEVADLLEKPTVTRLNNDDIFETSALIAQEIRKKTEVISRAVIVPSDSFIEAVAVSPLAGAQSWPILLAYRDKNLPSSTAQALEDLEVTSALVVGNETQLELAEVETTAGEDSYETAALVAQYAAENGLDFDHICIATGDGFPDPLAAAAYLALEHGILLLAKDGKLSGLTLELFDSHAAAMRILDIIALPALAKELTATSG